MRKILLISTFLVSGLSHGANWAYVTSSSTNEDYYVDKDYLNYNAKTGVSEIWVQSKRSSLTDQNKIYVSSKALIQYACSAKKQRTITSIEYFDNGGVSNSRTVPAKEFSIIFPDTVAESLWEAACLRKGKGVYLPRYLSEKDIKKVLPQLSNKSDDYTPEMIDLKSVGIN
ncbi:MULTISPECIES: surface-adhesin E family protein [Acinetobacter]|uniref:surface-adhesin E family protein n=1 Tax=Acinetobacter TaxID=469 RepID=UPI000A362A32|nr:MULTISPECIES: surface-adhesin E family protein [Acinetobacter]MBD8351750.1 hypothetical protein [Acinetobacter nosocomialis]OUJ87107.1 hypothetical protein BFG48_010720 [Acinetobacter nosocomialis]